MKKLASLMGRSFLLVAVIYFVTVTTSAVIFEIAEGKYDAVDSFWWAFTTGTRVPQTARPLVRPGSE
jgi:hypothetical protein